MALLRLCERHRLPEPERYHPDDLSLNNKKPALAGFFHCLQAEETQPAPRLVAEVFKLERLSKVAAAHNRHSTLQVITRFAGNA